MSKIKQAIKSCIVEGVDIINRGGYPIPKTMSKQAKKGWALICSGEHRGMMYDIIHELGLSLKKSRRSSIIIYGVSSHASRRLDDWVTCLHEASLNKITFYEGIHNLWFVIWRDNSLEQFKSMISDMKNMDLDIKIPVTGSNIIGVRCNVLKQLREIVDFYARRKCSWVSLDNSSVCASIKVDLKKWRRVLDREIFCLARIAWSSSLFGKNFLSVNFSLPIDVLVRLGKKLVGRDKTTFSDNDLASLASWALGIDLTRFDLTTHPKKVFVCVDVSNIKKDESFSGIKKDILDIGTFILSHKGSKFKDACKVVFGNNKTRRCARLEKSIPLMLSIDGDGRLNLPKITLNIFGAPFSIRTT